jgi:hypothetical protein
MRSVATLLPHYFSRRYESSLKSDPVGVLQKDEPLELAGQAPERAGLAADEHGGHRRPLPEVVMVRLRDGRAEAPLKLRLEREKLLALAFE